MIALSGLVGLVISVCVAGLILWLLWWLIEYINPPEPFKKVITVILAVAAVVFLINLLLGVSGQTPIFRWR